MTRLRRFAGLAMAAALTFALASCGGGSAYCDAIADAEEQFSSLGTFDPTNMDQVSDIQETLSGIAADAPDDIQSEWQNLVEAYQALADAEGDQTAIGEETMEKFSTLEQDLEVIQTHVQDECDIDMDM